MQVSVNNWSVHMSELKKYIHRIAGTTSSLVRQIGGKTYRIRGEILFFLHLVPFRLASTFLYVGGVQILVGFCQHVFFDFPIKLPYCQKREFSGSFKKNQLAALESLQKLHSNGYLDFFKRCSSYWCSKMWKLGQKLINCTAVQLMIFPKQTKWRKGILNTNVKWNCPRGTRWKYEQKHQILL
jgi:hypothetical protein